MNIVDVEGIGPVYAGKLEAAGVKTTDDLLERGATGQGPRGAGGGHRHRPRPASSSGSTAWTSIASSGIGSEYSDLLEVAGVDTVPELAQRNAANLTETLAEANAARNLVRRVPRSSMVTDWIEQAKKLPRVVEY